MHNFDEIVERKGTNAFKLELRDMFFGSNDVLPLWVADMDFSAPQGVNERIKQRAAHKIYGYTVRGEEFNSSIKNWLFNNHDWEIDTVWIEFTPGVLPAIVVAIYEFTQPKDKIIIQTPVYPPFYSIVKDNDRELVKNTLIEKDGYYTIDFDLLEEQASDPNTKMLIFSNPHNPVGRAWNYEELEKIKNICIKHDITIVSDEIHSDLCLFDNKHLVLANLFPELGDRLITAMAPSKTFNIAGLSTAYAIISDKKLKQKFHKRLYALQMHMGNLFGGEALVAAYNNGSDWLLGLKKYLENNILLVDEFIKTNMPEVGFVIPEATYLLWLDFRAWNLSPIKLRKSMIEIGKIGLNDGVSFGTDGAGFQRLNVGSPKTVLQEGLNRILKVREAVYNK